MESIPRLRFANLPTPVESLSRLSRFLGGPEILVKRDDLTGLAFGGNKTRKLEFLVAEAHANGADTLITAGALQSNHCRQTAAAAAKFGMDCILVLTVPDKKEVVIQPEIFTGNLLLDHLLHANIFFCEKEERESNLELIFQETQKSGKRPYLIPYGGSNPLGACAYAFAVREMLDQHIYPDYVVFPTSSGGTQAGLIVGAQLFNLDGQIIGISVDQPALTLEKQINNLAKETLVYMGSNHQLTKLAQVNSDYLGGGYGVFGDPEKEAISLFAQLEGLMLDPVYSGRAAAGLIDLVRKGFFDRNKTVLFWHTGGTPALFVPQYSLTLGE